MEHGYKLGVFHRNRRKTGKKSVKMQFLRKGGSESASLAMAAF
jgi:hypothetical protein